MLSSHSLREHLKVSYCILIVLHESVSLSRIGLCPFVSSICCYEHDQIISKIKPLAPSDNAMISI